MTGLPHAGSRRIVAYVDDEGRSRILADEHAPRAEEYQATPGMRTSILWATTATPTVPSTPVDSVPFLTSVHPVPGGSTFLVLTLPPDSVYASPAFNPTAAAEEQARIVPGIADRMELEAPGFHTTQTLDYVVVLSGMVWLVVDDGEVQLQAGDVVVQLGSRHAWQNRTEGPATLAVVLMGAERAGG